MSEFASGGLVRNPKPILPAEGGCDYVIPRTRKRSMTIVEFLTARLDEAEAKLQKVFSQQDRPHWPGCNYPGDMPGWCDCDLTEWLHAEIAAKRAIVADYASRDGDADLMLGPDCLRQREWSGLRVAVRHLASIDADHPDYDPDWSAA